MKRADSPKASLQKKALPPGRFRGKRKAPELTRDKLIEAAGSVFAERGYNDATIREICRRAGANVASVNYTFGDKMGLYTEVLRHSVRASKTAVMSAALDTSLTPEETIRGVIRARLMSLCRETRPDWHIRLVMHEFSHPTPAMARVVDEGMRPVYDRMRKAVGEVIGLPPDHETTRLSVNSIVGQILFYTFSWPVLSHLQPELKLTPEQLERIADHIGEFSLAYLKKVGENNHHV
jgi:AcrR family transcriptional regulator